MIRSIKKRALSAVLMLAMLISLLPAVTQPARAAGTILSPGDIVILAFNGTGGVDGFTFMPLVDLAAGTQIHFTDYGWNDDSGAFNTAEDSGSASGNMITYTAPKEITAGTLLRQDQANTGGDDFKATDGWENNFNNYNYINSLSYTVEGHDGIIAFQGSPTDPESPPIFIWAYHTGQWGRGSDKYYYWSDLPSGLNSGKNAVCFADLTASGNKNDDLTVDDGQYIGPTSAASAAAWRARVANAANWKTVTDNDPAVSYPTGSYQVGLAPPTVTSISPTGGSIAGGTSVTITGTNFTGATAVRFGTLDASSFTVDSDTQITAIAPAGTAGAKDVVVTAPGGTGTGTGLYSYVTAAPTIIGISPSSGPTTGGTSVTISGANFTGTTAVTIGGSAATSVTVVNDTTVTAVTAAGTVGAKDVVVTTPSGTGTGTGLYSYAAPVVTSVSVPGNATYIAGQNLDFTVSFSESVIVSGEPRISITVGAYTVNASYLSGSGTSALVFRYTVTEGQNDENGITVGTTLSANGGTIEDTNGNNADLTLNSVGSTLAVLIDTAAPAAGDGGTITIGDLSLSTVKLLWTGASDNLTAAGALQYLVVYSTSDDIGTVAEAETNGTAFGSWSADVTENTVTGLTAGTVYYFNVLVGDEAGNKGIYTAATAITAAAPIPVPTGGNAGVENDTPQDAVKLSTEEADGITITTLTIDDDKLAAILEQKGDNSTVTLPVSTGADVVIGELSGEAIKNMQAKEATLVIDTGNASYTLPASQINIDSISEQFGTQVALSDLTVRITIAEPSDEAVAVVQNIAEDGGFTLVVPALEFTISCEYNGTTLDISSFNSYVERTIAIPDGADPNKITTAIVVDPDGTVRHVPTQIISIDGKYYAKIRSMTNSTYSVIWNPVKFADVSHHWAEDAINDMGSRMVVNGVGDNNFEPERNMTRGEFAAIIIRALGLSEGTEESYFDDVKITDWYNGCVDTAAAYSLVIGYNGNFFRPHDLITREQAMVIIARSMKLTGLEISLTDSEITALIGGFTDAAGVSDYAEESAAVCLKAGILTGTTANTLSPGDYIKRAEVAIMVQRLLQESGLI